MEQVTTIASCVSRDVFLSLMERISIGAGSVDEFSIEDMAKSILGMNFCKFVKCSGVECHVERGYGNFGPL